MERAGGEERTGVMKYMPITKYTPIISASLLNNYHFSPADFRRFAQNKFGFLCAFAPLREIVFFRGREDGETGRVREVNAISIILKFCSEPFFLPQMYADVR